jgi:uncharacterized protein YhaN
MPLGVGFFILSQLIFFYIASVYYISLTLNSPNTMKQYILSASILLLSIACLTSCVTTQKYDQALETNKRLQDALAKERDENAQLSSFRISLENQFREKNKQYEDCQETSKETMESLTARYNSLQLDYQKATESFKQLNGMYDQSKKNDGLLIADLERRLKECLTTPRPSARRYRRR